MKIDGRAIANTILENLKTEVTKLKKRGVTPTLAVILVGDNPASLSYIKQKQKAAETIGAKLILDQKPFFLSLKDIKVLINKYNNDPTIHGLIVQRPLPKELGDTTDALSTISPQKDVDGFLPNSPYTPPVALAVLSILELIYHQQVESRNNITMKQFNNSMNGENKPATKDFPEWLRSQCITVLGRGETAGKPIADSLSSLHCTTWIIHSKTPNPYDSMRKADIVVSCVGKERVVTKDTLKPGAMLIGVGLWRDSQEKLHGDYEEDEIRDVASYYTPTPGGVGPVNVACLMQNLVQAAQSS